MIQQFTELGEFFIARDGVAGDELARYAQDPASKARGKTVIVLVFSTDGFQHVQVEEYNASHRLWYLYRAGPANGFDATSTTRMAAWDRDKPGDFEEKNRKRLVRLFKSAREARSSGGPLVDWEQQALVVFENADPEGIFRELALKEPDSKGQATLTLAWQTLDGELKRVGDFRAYQENLIRRGRAASSSKKTTGIVKGTGTCSICGRVDQEVSGLLQIQDFKFYTTDKRGSVSGGFDPTAAWRNFPACRQCSERADYSSERIKKELQFKYYGEIKYLVLPCPIATRSTAAFDFLGRLTSGRMSAQTVRVLTEAEDELLYVISEEKDLLQVDLLFYIPDKSYFRPALYVSGLLPSRFRLLFRAKAVVDGHPWLRPPFARGEFTFKALRDVFPSKRGRGRFDDDFLGATVAALELRAFPASRLLSVGMRWVREEFSPSSDSSAALAALFRALLFFEVVTGRPSGERMSEVQIDYGDSEQADRVRRTFSECSGRLRESAASQAAFLIGACCRRIEHIQTRIRKATPFVSKYKGLRLTRDDMQRLFVEAQAKAIDYGPDEEVKVIGLLTCAGAALAAEGERWDLSPDEVSFFFALGRALSGRLAKDQEEPPAQGGADQ